MTRIRGRAHRSPSPRVPGMPRTLIAIAAALLLPVSAAEAARSPQPTVHLRGTAYEFNNVPRVLAGRRSASPSSRAGARRSAPTAPTTSSSPTARRSRRTSRRRGTTRSTSRRSRPTARTSPTSTSRRRRTGSTRPSPALLHVPARQRRRTPRSARSSRPSARRTCATCDYAGFIAYGAHGVAGATASATPALPKPIYFNEIVIPDPAQAALVQGRRRDLDRGAGRRLHDPRAAPDDAVRELRRDAAGPGGS